MKTITSLVHLNALIQAHIFGVELNLHSEPAEKQAIADLLEAGLITDKPDAPGEYSSTGKTRRWVQRLVETPDPGNGGFKFRHPGMLDTLIWYQTNMGLPPRHDSQTTNGSITALVAGGMLEINDSSQGWKNTPAGAAWIQALIDTDISDIEDPDQPLGPITQTIRNYDRIEFTDRSDRACFLEVSSIADHTVPGASAIMIGLVETKPVIPIPEAIKAGIPTDRTEGWMELPFPEGTLIPSYAHLRRQQVEALIGHLQTWLKTEKLG